MDTVNHKLVEIALEHVGGSDFERFFHAFYPAVAGIQFVPLGGVHDGGADAFLDDGVFEARARKPGTFYQASVAENHRSKIRRTIERLHEVGRQPKTLHYFTSRPIRLIDKEQEELSGKLGVFIQIRDRKWVASNINCSSQTVRAFQTYLRPSINFLDEIGGTTLIRRSPNISTLTTRTMCVFLGQEIDRRRGNTDLLNAVTDSLILWALEGTDPDANKLMKRDKIVEKIEVALPSAKHFIRGVFDYRIEMLASKSNLTGREVRWHRKQDTFCLPYETRQIVTRENTEDEFLKLEVMNVYKCRVEQLLHRNETISPDQVANAAHRALELTFEREGLDLAEFLTGRGEESQPFTISDQVDKALTEVNLSDACRARAKEIALAVLRHAFYNSTEAERVYYGKLSRTYTLLFTLRNEPKIVEYFKGMSANFVLFVGSDIIIRALSERYLADEDQMTVNMLRILREAGSTLVLTQTAVEEIQSHLVATDREFQNYFVALEPYVDKEIARHASKILIRAYFYAKFYSTSDSRPIRWSQFIEQICTYRDLYDRIRSRREVKNYLIEKFGCEYLDKENLEKLTDSGQVRELADRIKEIKSSEILALNDARQILAIYGKRKILNEDHSPNPYGYRVWWLTHENRVIRFTRDLVDNYGAWYIIRPEFILNFIALSPTTAEVRQSYEKIFPTLLGIKLSNRMRDDVFHNVMEKAKAVRAVDDARARVMMTDMSNRLKGDNFRTYETELVGREVDGLVVENESPRIS